MDDPLWASMNGTNLLKRQQLELVIQDKKLTEVFNWFRDHFVICTTAEYIARCPIVILQGPTGCGKTTTLKWISNELKVPIKEYSETTDITDINHEFSARSRESYDNEKTNLSHHIDKRKAAKFEHFIINNILYSQLYPTHQNCLAREDSEFESDDDDDPIANTILPTKSNGNKNNNGNTNGNGNGKPPPIPGIIFHIDTPLTFVRNQPVLMQTLLKLIKVIREISPRIRRRTAIVFETLEGEGEIISLSTKFKTSLKIQVLKFNPITDANMKKLAESLVKGYRHITINKDTIKQLVSDCDGDIRACINTLQLICNRSPDLHVFKQINHNSININEVTPSQVQQAIKKRKTIHEHVRQVELNPSLMRDNTRSLSFFHVLGKIFYQKRLYPNLSNGASLKHYRSVERPFPTENSTEHLVNLLDIEPRNLITWIHQHYYEFCSDYNIDKAALFMDNLSSADVTSLNSLQSSQFYEMHSVIDQLQTCLIIESTTYSLYEDQRKVKEEKTLKNSKSKTLLKSSVEELNPNGRRFGFNKPTSMNVTKLISDYQLLLQPCKAKLIDINSKSVDPLKVLLDYVPYITHLSNNWVSISPENKTKYYSNVDANWLRDVKTMKVFETLSHLKYPSILDPKKSHDRLEKWHDKLENWHDELENRHDELVKMIEDIESRQSKDTQVNR